MPLITNGMLLEYIYEVDGNEPADGFAYPNPQTSAEELEYVSKALYPFAALFWIEKVAPADTLPITSSVFLGVTVLIPRRLSVLFQNKFALFETVFVPFQNVTRPFAPVPVIGFVSAFCLLLNVLQSVLLKAPLFVALAVGRLNVCVDVADDILKSVPAVPVANV